mmetsp:Transcript_28723/g.73434  ORF Transcript_28723/g.73434 Transcript_28723/m.73434 type:complete len:94 (-) Transcript_28723:346-627(-)
MLPYSFFVRRQRVHLPSTWKRQWGRREANQLKSALQREGHDAYVCQVAPGANIKEVVVRRLAAAKLVVILGTKTPLPADVVPPSLVAKYRGLV